MNIPENCRECEFGSTCNNPAPYGHYRCKYKKEIEKRTIEKFNSSVNKNSSQCTTERG